MQTYFSLQSLLQGSTKSWKYFESNYGFQGKVASVETWARYSNLGLLAHNLHVERYHGVIKKKLKPHMRIDVFMHTLIKVNQKYHRKDICTELNIRGAFQPSSAQREYCLLHPGVEAAFTVKANETGYDIKESPDSDNKTCSVIKKPPTCNRELCQITCPNCPDKHCMHEYACTCDWYSYRNMCSHLHLVSIYLSSMSKEPVVSVSQVDDDPEREIEESRPVIEPSMSFDVSFYFPIGLFDIDIILFICMYKVDGSERA